MQNDALRKLSDVFSYTGSFLNKAKKIKKNSTGSQAQVHADVKIEKSSSISPTITGYNHNSCSPFSEVAKSALTTAEEKKQFLSVHTTTTTTTTTGTAGSGRMGGNAPVGGGLPSSVVKGPLKSTFNNINGFSNNTNSGGKSTGPISPGASKIFTKEEPPIVHYPFSVSSLDQFSPQRRVWLQNCLSPHGGSTGGGVTGVDGGLTGSMAAATVAVLNPNVLKSGSAWDTIEDHHVQVFNKQATAYNNPNEATGLLFVKLMQVTNKATSKLFDVEWSLRIGNVERTSYPARSFKDSPGNTATMNEVFLFDVNEPFQLEMSVTGNPVPTKFGTMAGFSNNQTAQLGHLDLNFCLDPLERSVRTYKLRRPQGDDGSSNKGKTDCEVVVMIGLHVLEEPVEDRSWETEALYQGFLTVMARGGRVASWKRYWAVLEGRALKLYDAEYQLKRDVIAVIPLAHISRVQLPDYDKVDVGANGLSLLIHPQGVDLTSSTFAQTIDRSELDYCMYAFTDSSHFHEVWLAHLEETLEQYQENMVKRRDMEVSRMNRRRTQPLSRHSFETTSTFSTSSAPVTPLDPVDGVDDEGGCRELIDVKFVW
ncbi:hypothetical protein BGZ95_010604 [Linnemannia exigua]|uniref:PH domain-containing protein n=1 Tax=Linnemannia exigua TaxID=604196 RepID=A0AAD4DBL2_9FUNG|nr:hypothetical protein BGZ95_010604 [Linnemannia exigua]